MSDATTPANPTDQIAATPAVLSPEPPIVPTSGTKRVPDDSEAAVVQDAQLVRMSVLGCEGCPHSSTCGVFNIRGGDDWPCIAALERLEAERDALLAEHDAVHRLKDAWEIGLGVRGASEVVISAHDNAERVIHDE